MNPVRSSTDKEIKQSNLNEPASLSFSGKKKDLLKTSNGVKKKSANSGFSALELIVVISIVVIISALILANYPGFNEQLSVRRDVEEIASNIRQAQAHGLGVKEIIVSSVVYFPGYGVYFETGQPTFYISYADLNRDFLYQPPNEKIKEIPIQGKGRIYQLCANVKSNPPGDCALSSATVTYTRPTPQVTLQGSGSPVCGSASGSYCDIEIKIRGSRGTTKTVVLWLSGQISVE